MKTLTAIAIAVAASLASPAIARDHTIYRHDGNLILQQANCPTGGKEATFIENRSNGGGAYGCWEMKGDTIYVRWNTFIGPTGSVINSSVVQQYPAPEALRR